jgi:hypothetical protein
MPDAKILMVADWMNVVLRYVSKGSCIEAANALLILVCRQVHDPHILPHLSLLMGGFRIVFILLPISFRRAMHIIDAMNSLVLIGNNQRNTKYGVITDEYLWSL